MHISQYIQQTYQNLRKTYRRASARDRESIQHLVLIITCFFPMLKWLDIILNGATITHLPNHIISDTLSYVVGSIILYTAAIILLSGTAQTKNDLIILTKFYPPQKDYLQHWPYYILQTLSTLSGIPLLLHHLGCHIPYSIGITIYASTNAILVYIPRYIHQRLYTNTIYQEIIDRLSEHRKIQHMRDITNGGGNPLRPTQKEKRRLMQKR